MTQFHSERLGQALLFLGISAFFWAWRLTSRDRFAAVSTRKNRDLAKRVPI
jgi:hypothetical protein